MPVNPTLQILFEQKIASLLDKSDDLSLPLVNITIAIKHLVHSYSHYLQTVTTLSLDFPPDFDNFDDLVLPYGNVVPFTPRLTDYNDSWTSLHSTSSSKSNPPSSKPKRRGKPGQPKVSRKSKSSTPTQQSTQPQPQSIPDSTPAPIISGYSWGDGFYGQEYYGVKETKEIVNNDNIVITSSGLVDTSDLMTELSQHQVQPTVQPRSTISTFDYGSQIPENPMDDEFVDDLDGLDNYWDA